MTAVDIFIAYSHKDIAFKDELRVHLRPLVRANRAQIWDDYDIEAGREWDAAIKERLYGAQIILLLVSPDSLNSDYFYGKEVTLSLERHAKGEAVVVPVILRACLWQQTPLGALEALPTKGRPVASWPSRDDAWNAVAQEVSELVDARQQELVQLSALEAQRQQFNAAVLAADQLFAQNRWTEAQKGYTHALGLHQDGFEPAQSTLMQRQADADTRQRQMAEQEALAQRKVDFQQIAAKAEGLYSQEKWADAQGAFQEALKRYEPGFQPDAGTLRARQAACEAALRQTAQAAQQRQLAEQAYLTHFTEANKQIRRRQYARALTAVEQALTARPGDPEALRLKSDALTALQQAPLPSAPASGGSRTWLIGIGGIALLLVVLWIWKPWKDRKVNPVEDRSKTEKPDVGALNNGNVHHDAENEKMPEENLRAMRTWLTAHPHSVLANRVQTRMKTLAADYNTQISKARRFVNDKEEWGYACNFVNKALSIDPDGKEAKDLEKQLRCR